MYGARFEKLRDDVVSELNERGFSCRGENFERDGVVHYGIVDSETTACPVVFIERAVELVGSEFDVVALADFYGSMFNGEGFGNSPAAEDFLDADFARSRFRILFRRKSDEPVVAKNSPYEGIERYLAVVDEPSGMSMKVVPGYLGHVGIKENEAWKLAERNMKGTGFVERLSNVVGSVPGVPVDDNPMVLVSNSGKRQGASSILLEEVRKRAAKLLGTNEAILIPSSVHEVLLLPNLGNVDMDALNDMVRSVNEGMVSPDERLSDRAYEIDLSA